MFVQGVRKGKSFDTKAEAQGWVNDTERKIKTGQGVTVAGRTFEDLLMRFYEEECPHRTRQKWEQTRILFLCRDPIAKLRLDKLTAEEIDRWQKRRLKEVTGSTLRRDRALISTVMKHGQRIWKWVEHSPFRDVRLPEGNPDRDRVCSEDELARLWHVAGTAMTTLQARTIAAFEIAIETGMRGAEIARIHRKDVHLDKSYVRLPKTKNGSSRDVALSPRAKDLLEQVMALGLDPVWNMTAAQKDSHFRRLRDKAAIEGLNFHDSRHTACTRLAKKLSVLDLARQLGTKDINTLMIYYNSTATERAALLTE